MSIVNECIEDQRLVGRSGVIYKLDLEKAFDHVNWEFLDYILERMSFGPKWSSWMFFCICLSKYWFLLIVGLLEVLSKIIKKAEGVLISGFLVGDGSCCISHL